MPTISPPPFLASPPIYLGLEAAPIARLHWVYIQRKTRDKKTAGTCFSSICHPSKGTSGLLPSPHLGSQAYTSESPPSPSMPLRAQLQSPHLTSPAWSALLPRCQRRNMPICPIDRVLGLRCCEDMFANIFAISSTPIQHNNMNIWAIQGAPLQISGVLSCRLTWYLLLKDVMSATVILGNKLRQ